MFIIWYFSFSFLYIITLTFDFFFCKILKLNSKLSSIIFQNIESFFNFYSVTAGINNLQNNSVNQNTNATFKNIYNEYSFYYKDTLNNQLLSTYILIPTILNKKLIYIPLVIFLNSRLSYKANLSNKLDLGVFANINYAISNVNNISKKASILSYTMYKYNLNLKKLNLVSISDNLLLKVSNSWVVKYSPSNFLKYINLTNLNSYNILYLRKNKVFNKGRYSRNRQYYRTGVYWCLYINIIAVIGIYFWFYKFTINFGYLWWALFIFIASFLLPKAIKYRLYNLSNLKTSFYKDIIWVSLVMNNLSMVLINAFSAALSLTCINKIKNNLPYLNSNNSIFIWEYSNSNYYSNSESSSSNYAILNRLHYTILSYVNLVLKLK